MEPVRAFIAVDIGDEIRARLDALQRELIKVHANVRWVQPRNIHLTLAFLGNVPPEQIGLIRNILDDASGRTSAFKLAASGVGFFGRPGRPRVLWAGVADCPPLHELRSRLDRRLCAAGIEYDSKPFTPHLTLGRVKRIDPQTGLLLEKLEAYTERKAGATCIDHVDLIQSVPARPAAKYTLLHRAPFM